jgi:hypothetical protein
MYLAACTLNTREVSNEHRVHVAFCGAVSGHQWKREISPAQCTFVNVSAVSSPDTFQYEHGVKVLAGLKIIRHYFAFNGHGCDVLGLWAFTFTTLNFYFYRDLMRHGIAGGHCLVIGHWHYLKPHAVHRISSSGLSEYLAL